MTSRRAAAVGVGCSEQQAVVEGRGLSVSERGYRKFPECLQMRG